MTLGKATINGAGAVTVVFLCRVSLELSAKRALPINFFAVCSLPRQRLCRVQFVFTECLRPSTKNLDPVVIKDQYESWTSGESNLPGIDVFITTVDPVDEPILYTVNSVLSILATDYPVEKYACYLSDDGGTLVHYEAMLEVASFAKLWAPFCRKHGVEPRAPESYFGVKRQPYTGSMQRRSSRVTTGACAENMKSSR